MKGADDASRDGLPGPSYARCGCPCSATYANSLIEIVGPELITESCPCLCCYDLSVRIGDLAPGDYTVVFTGHDDTNGWEEWAADIEVGDTGQTGRPSVVASANSGCIDPTAAPESGFESGTWGRPKALYR